MILEACGVTKGMFFYYFKNKLDLGLALAKRTRAIEQEALTRLSETALEHSEDPLEQVLFILEHLKRRYPVRQGQQPYGSLLTVFVYEPDLFSAETDAVIRSMVRDWKDTFVSRFRQLEVGGRVKARPPAESVANHLVAMLEGGQVLARITQRPRVIQEQLDHCQRYLQLLYRQ